MQLNLPVFNADLHDVVNTTDMNLFSYIIHYVISSLGNEHVLLIWIPLYKYIFTPELNACYVIK